jgi:hypothetical protein
VRSRSVGENGRLFKEHPRMDWFYLGIVLLCFAATWGFMHLVDRV